MIADCPMEYRWGGLLCLSRNTAPAFGEVEDSLFSACCQNGLGTAMGTASGIAIAEKICGQNSTVRTFMEQQPSPQKLPPAPLASVGANAYLRWSEFKAGEEL